MNIKIEKLAALLRPECKLTIYNIAPSTVPVYSKNAEYKKIIHSTMVSAPLGEPSLP